LRKEDECENEREIAFSRRDFLCLLFSSFYGNLIIFVFTHSASALKVLINVKCSVCRFKVNEEQLKLAVQELAFTIDFVEPRLKFKLIAIQATVSYISITICSFNRLFRSQKIVIE
jgi:hypothetical protein